MKKRNLAFLLTLVMAFSLFVFPSSAASSIDVSLSSTPGEVGSEITVYVDLNIYPSYPISISEISILLNYDNTAL